MNQARRHALPDVSESYSFPTEHEAEQEQLSEIINEIKETADKLAADSAQKGDLKILARAMRELRYAFKVFTPYRRQRKVTVFGSARTKPDSPVYQLAVDYGRRMAEEGWYVLTGAGGGIMEAGHVGAGKNQSMGVNIMLPFEQGANPIIDGDPKLVTLKYFFTRKLLFVKEVHAIAIFPGGFGTLDECFETLTLVQTGKRDLMPIVLVDVPGGTYWTKMQEYIDTELNDAGLISGNDRSLYTITDSVDAAVQEVMRFYCVYNSMRYVGGDLYLRLHIKPDEALVEQLNEKFAHLLVEGKIEVTEMHPHEADDIHLRNLPRLKMQFNRRDIGGLREMINFINDELGDQCQSDQFIR